MDDEERMDSRRKDSKPARRPKVAPGVRRPAKKGRVRVVIADDDPIILKQIGILLEARFDVVGRARNGRELVEAVQRLSPAVVVADITMPEMNGIEATREITKTYSSVKVVMLSVHGDSVFVEAAFEAGASGYVSKFHASKELIPAIRSVLAGRMYRSRGLR